MFDNGTIISIKLEDLMDNPDDIQELMTFLNGIHAQGLEKKRIRDEEYASRSSNRKVKKKKTKEELLSEIQDEIDYYESELRDNAVDLQEQKEKLELVKNQPENPVKPEKKTAKKKIGIKKSVKLNLD